MPGKTETLNKEHFLTDQTLRERMGLRRIKPEPMAAFKTDLYRKIDTLQIKLQQAETVQTVMGAAIVGLLLVCTALAAIVYFNGQLPTA